MLLSTRKDSLHSQQIYIQIALTQTPGNINTYLQTMCIYDVTGKNKLVGSICQQSYNAPSEKKKKKSNKKLDSKLIFSTSCNIALALTKIID